ncbi:MAG: condensation domain-containing protein, partial [Acidobacteriota bacterium]|nr:condensation domain-containing protein [Acidobacteriota bacterium]
EKADVCVSEIIGTIGSSEGTAPILNDSRRFLKDGGAMIPQRCLTKIAAVRLPDEISNEPGFTELTGHYTEKVFEQVGHKFDVRLCIKNFPKSNLISNVETFEDLDFTVYTEPEYNREVNFTFSQDTRFDGFLLWLNLHTIESETIDTLEDKYSWLPVYFPVFDPGIEVLKGDRITAVCSSMLSDNGVNPDYKIEGRLIRQNGEVSNFCYESSHHSPVYKKTGFYRRLFSEDSIKIGAKSRSEVTSISLRAYLSRQLPSYMVPADFVMLEEIPITSSGKVDRRALPVPDRARPEQEGNFVAPRTLIEKELAAIWAEVLRLERVGTQDNFFELGGHSLLATQVTSRIRKTFQVELPLRAFFESPTVTQLAARIEAARQTNEGLETPPLLPVSRDVELPLSFAQERLWFIDQLEPGVSAYNSPDAIRLKGQLNIITLQQTLDMIVARHEVLRTTFAAVHGRPVQVIAESGAVGVPVVDLSNLPESKLEAEAQRLVMEEAQLPFDLSRGPLIRARLLRLGEEEHILVLTMHHIVNDGWSAGVLFRELGALYKAYSEGGPSPLEELPIQYADYAVWQREWLRGEVLEKQLSYWRAQLAGSPAILELPTDRPRPAVQSFHGAYQSRLLSENLSEALRKLSRQEGVTLFMTLLAGFQTLLMRHSGREDIIVGTDVANRNQAETEALIGFFLNHLVLRTKVSGNQTFHELLERVREVTLEAYAHQDVPFNKLVEALKPERTLSHTPLFQVLFVLQNAPMQPLELPSLILSPVEFDSGTSKFDLAVFMEETKQGLAALWVYRTDLFDPATITRMASHFEMLLESIVTQPDARLSTLEMATESEKRQQAEEMSAHEESRHKKLKSTKRKAIGLS